ncbi:NUDIX domain-containing protein [Magnetospira sp. QH-2]|uniref:NUDIX domain-containing protein n=1 Tax=Magnetospira sp. (strain QH-2) TaxID=1288970 RepID=UPI0003E80FE5|nr:NUDIX hydrolase [Magnetospira sp. QH-2]CCQ74401.1 putative NUDIX hydrolase [Magnetospira sp. QH-2]
MIDGAWRLFYRLAYPLARLVWRLTGRSTHGAVVAIIHDESVLVVQPSYRRGLSLPGGYLHAGELPRHAAARELGEELGLRVAAEDLTFVVQVQEGRDRTDCFVLRIDQVPILHMDRREIISAQFVAFDQILSTNFVSILRPFIETINTSTFD